MFLVLAFVYVFLYLGPFYYTRFSLKMNWINPVTIVLIVNFPIDIFKLIIGPYLLLDGTGTDGLYFAYLMSILRLCIQFILITFYLRLKQLNKLSSILIGSKKKFNTNHFRKLEYFFLILAICFFLVLASRSGVFLKWFINPRDAYINNRVGNGIFYALSINFFSISSFFSFFRKSRVRSLTISFIFYSILMYPFGSKGLYINLFIFYLISVWRLDLGKLRKVAPYMGSLVLFLVLLNFNNNIGNISFTQISAYFDYYFNAARYYDDFFSGKHVLEYGNIFLSSFWEYIPRGIYPEKPFIYGVLHIVEYYYPGGPASGNTPAFGGEVEYFADFGVLGVIFFNLFDFSLLLKSLFWIACFRFKIFYNQQFSLIEILILIYLFAPSFGIYAPSILFIVLILILSILIDLRRRVKFKKA